MAGNKTEQDVISDRQALQGGRFQVLALLFLAVWCGSMLAFWLVFNSLFWATVVGFGMAISVLIIAAGSWQSSGPPESADHE